MLKWARWLIPSESVEVLSTDSAGDLLDRGDPGGGVDRDPLQDALDPD